MTNKDILTSAYGTMRTRSRVLTDTTLLCFEDKLASMGNTTNLVRMERQEFDNGWLDSIAFKLSLKPETENKQIEEGVRLYRIMAREEKKKDETPLQKKNEPRPGLLVFFMHAALYITIFLASMNGPNNQYGFVCAISSLVGILCTLVGGIVDGLLDENIFK